MQCSLTSYSPTINKASARLVNIEAYVTSELISFLPLISSGEELLFGVEVHLWCGTYCTPYNNNNNIWLSTCHAQTSTSKLILINLIYLAFCFVYVDHVLVYMYLTLKQHLLTLVYLYNKDLQACFIYSAFQSHLFSLFC